MKARTLQITACFILMVFLTGFIVPSKEPPKDVFSKDNLLAWCIVPFDAKKRGPEERAKMLSDLGVSMLAYDWRDEHIPTFDQELEALKKHDIKLQAFWMTSGKNPAGNHYVQTIFDFLERNKVKTQIWLLMGEWEGFSGLSQDEKVVAMSEPIKYIAQRAEKIGCQVGLYNHGGWFGEPENQLAIIDYLDLSNVGIVYNFHHAREHLERFPGFFPKIEPHLLALNLAGLKKGNTEQFFGVGEGNAEEEMIRIVWESDYNGPIGIINHQTNRDAKVGLEKEIEGLKKILASIGDKKALKTYK